MNTRLIGFAACALGTFAVAPVAAVAQTQEPDAPNELKTAARPFAARLPQLVPDAAFRAMTGRLVALRLQDGAVVGGRLIGLGEDTVTLAVPLRDDVSTFDKRSIITLRAVDEPEVLAVDGARGGSTPEVSEERAPRWEKPAADRHVALLIGVAPSVALDADYGLFYAFAAVAVAVPVATSNHMVPMVVGGGLNLRIARRWKFEVYAHYSPMRLCCNDVEWYHGVGGGVGLHFTSKSGLTLGFKLPVFGYAVRQRDLPGAYPASIGIQYYYTTAFASLPVASIGYRF